MRKLTNTTRFLSLLLTCTWGFTFAQTPFVTTWKTDNAGTSGSTSITIPTRTGFTYNYNVDWDNDGTFDQFNITGNVTHDFGAAGEYEIGIEGTFPSIYFNNGGDRLKLLSIDQWGDINWLNMASAFYGCSNLVYYASDVPDLSNVSSMNAMFRSCTLFNGAIGGWNTSSVTDMGNMFLDASAFNQNIESWDVSNVTNMHTMFRGASAFNQPLNGWNTSSVANMAYMFRDAIAFNQNIEGWDLSSLTTTRQMFFGASAFNQPLNGWSTGNVSDMRHTFANATAFNQPLDNWALHSSVNLASMLDNCGMDCATYSATLIGWSAGSPPTGRNLGAAGLQYSTDAEAARTNLVSNYSWTITDGGGTGTTCEPLSLLPVELLFFQAASQDKMVKLTWATGSEIQADQFKVEHSTDGFSFRAIGEVKAAGHSSGRNDYSYLHENPAAGINYYRIRQVDFDGSFEYSAIRSIEVKRTGPAVFTVYPNPATDQVTIQLPGLEGAAKLEVTNRLGRVVWSRQLDDAGNGIQLDLDKKTFPNGYYLLYVTAQGERLTQRLFIAR